jgi:hypothetical protein
LADAAVNGIYLQETRQGLGISGLWIGFMIGLLNQSLWYLWTIHSQGWEHAVIEAKDRADKEMEGKRFKLTEALDDNYQKISGSEVGCLQD